MAQPFVQPCDSSIIAAQPCPRALRREVTPQRRRMVLIACVLASSMAFIDGSALTVALPKLRASFGADLASVQWVLNGYVLALAALTLIGGALADVYGKARMLGARLSRFRSRLGRLRGGAVDRVADCVAPIARRLGGDPDAGEPGADRRDLPERRTQRRHRRMGGGVRAHHRRRAGAGRLADRSVRLAVGVRDQSAAGAGRRRAAGALRAAGRPRTAPVRSYRRGDPGRGARPDRLGAEPDRTG